MERLTAMRNGVAVYVGPGCKYDTGMISAELSSEHIRQVLTRLSAYEDTELEPEKIKNLISRALLGELESPEMEEYNGSALERADRLIAEYESVGPIDHLQELTQAEKDGRLVVLNEPRKLLVWGDDSHNTILCPNCNHDLMGGFREDEYCEKDMYQCPYCGQSIDSTKVMTREEAEAALKKREEADNEENS